MIWKISSLASAMFVIGILFVLSTEVCAQDSGTLDERVAAFEKNYSIKIVTKGHEFSNKVEGEDSDKVGKYLPLLLEEFSLYPKGALSKAGVSKIVLCKNLAWDKQKRGAIPGFSSGILYYDAERASYDKSYLRSIIHHEFFHQIDWRDDGKVYVDEQWVKLNPKKFSYGKGGAAVQGDFTQGKTFEKPGFMNKYSTQGVEEDKAEIFAYLVVRSDVMNKRVRKDPFVEAKVKMMKELMRSFSSEFDEQFWENAAKVRGSTKLDDSIGVRDQMNAHVDAMGIFFKTDLAIEFLKSTEFLPEVKPFELYFETGTDARQRLKLEGLNKQQWESLAPKVKKNYGPLTISEQRYYFHRYGSPMSFVRVLDLVAKASEIGTKKWTSMAGKKVIDFGFGAIAPSRIMASAGAYVTAIDTDPFLKGLYSRPQDSGTIPHFSKSKVDTDAIGDDGKKDGTLQILIGSFPADKELAAQVGVGIDLFVAKNTLKRGYVHPAQRVDPKRKIELGVSDEVFVQTVFDRLNDGGYFMIYNLHPKRTKPGKGYQTWSDGRCPFDRALIEKIGFSVLEYDKDDTKMAHSMGTALGLDKAMNLDTQFRATYTLLRK